MSKEHKAELLLKLVVTCVEDFEQEMLDSSESLHPDVAARMVRVLEQSIHRLSSAQALAHDVALLLPWFDPTGEES